MATQRLSRGTVAVAIGLLVLTCGGPGQLSTPEPSGARAGVLEQTRRTLLPTPAFAREGTTDIADIAERTVSSVVNISSEKVAKVEGRTPFGPFFQDPFFRHFFGEGFNGPQVPREHRERSLGSGVIVSRDGTVLTNNHVVENAEEVQVTLTDGRVFETKLVGTDPESDLAVLKLEGDLEGLAPVAFGDSDDLRLGDVVLAIGNPFGVGQTVTMGIVSAKGRANVGIVDYEDFIQTDAAINPGNSGGALVNMRGELVGINTAILSRSGGYQGIGFAIPSNMVRPIMTSLLEHGKVLRGWLGVAIQDLTPDLEAAFKLSDSQGALISDVTGGSPAEKAGLARGDVVLRFNGHPVDGSARLRNLVAIAGPNATVEAEVLRDGKRKTLTIVLGAKEDADEGIALGADEGALGGLTLSTLDAGLRKHYGITEGVNGVVVTRVADGSAAARAGFREGDVIRELNRQPVASVRDFTKLYEKARGTVAILVQRDDRVLFLAMRKDG